MDAPQVIKYFEMRDVKKDRDVADMQNICAAARHCGPATFRRALADHTINDAGLIGYADLIPAEENAWRLAQLWNSLKGVEVQVQETFL